MIIKVSGFQGLYINATIEAYVGMKFLGKTVTKVNKKSIVVSLDADPEKQTTASDDLRLPFWTLSACDLPTVKTADGNTYQPKPVETAMHTLCQMNIHDAVSAIAGVSEALVYVGDAKKTSITDTFDQINSLTVLTVVNRLVNG